MKLYWKFAIAFVVGMGIVVGTAYWWFGPNYTPSPTMPFGTFMLLDFAHCIISAATVTCGFAAILEYLIERESNKTNGQF